MTDSYLSWFDSLGEEGLANNCPVPPTAPIQAQYQVEVVDVFCGSIPCIFFVESHSFPIGFGIRNVALREGDAGVPAALIRNGIMPCAPHHPTVGVHIRLLELYRNNSLRCPQLAIQPFVKGLCDLHGNPFRPYLSKQFSTCFDLYLSIRQNVHQRIQVAIGRDSPNWRLRHACPACTHKLEDEPKLKFEMLVTMDGNDSLKRILRRGAAPVNGEDGDEPTVGKSNERMDGRDVDDNYYIPREKVDLWAKEVLAAKTVAAGFEEVPEADNNSGCEDRWKNMADGLTARMWGIFYETGIFLALCRHGFALVVADMIQSGEL
jgi:hypothetical protein